MIKFFTKRMNNEKGFTLIELIVVIAILGILAAIAIPRLGVFRRDADKAANESTAAIVYKAIQMADAAGTEDPEKFTAWGEYTDLEADDIAETTTEGKLTVVVTGTVTGNDLKVVVGDDDSAGTFPKE